MTQEVFEKMKEEYIRYVKEFMKDFGEFQPLITVFADINDEDKSGVIHIPIPPQFMKDEDSKDQFVNEVIPDVFADIKEKFTPYAVACTLEAWMRTAKNKEEIENYKQLPNKKEVVLMSFQQKDKTVSMIFNIKRGNKQVNAAGDLVDQIELEEDVELSGSESMAGRFSNLFSKFDD